MNKTDIELKIKEINKEIGIKLYDIRQSRGLTRNVASDMIGVTHQQLAKYESGVNKINIGRLLIFCKLFDVDINYFLDNIVKKDYDVENTAELVKQSTVTNKYLSKISDEKVRTAAMSILKHLSKS